MAGELKRASERLDERKNAIVGRVAEQATPVTKEALLGVFSGFDLEPEEIAEMEVFLAGHGLSMVAEGCPPPHMVASVWVDGLAMGLLIAEERAKAGAS